MPPPPRHGTQPTIKGGGPRGGPKRWTGNGPRPARHIPWPEIFKHHISLIEGHLKMTEMVKKHTVPDTGNWRTISAIVNRSYEILSMAKDAAKNFVPPAGQLDQVPIGVSSASMYPGYSPADHVYGDAAQEFGTAVSIAKAKGIEIPSEPDGPEYQIAQARGIKMRTLAQVRAAKAARGEGSGSGTGSGSDAQAASARTIGPVTNGHAKQGAGEDGTEEGESQFFVIDTNPTPVNLPGIISKSTKRTSEDRSPPEPTEKKKSKKVKTKHDGELPLNVENERVELEDISEEVDARLKEKEEKRKRKEEKKRKRESEGSNLTAEKVADAVAEMEKSKKKKSKKSEGGDMLEKSALKKRHGASDEEVGDGEGKKKKKRKKNEG